MEDGSKGISVVSEKDFDIFDLLGGGREWRRKNGITQIRWAMANEEIPGQTGIGSRELKDGKSFMSEESLMDEFTTSTDTIPDGLRLLLEPLPKLPQRDRSMADTILPLLVHLSKSLPLDLKNGIPAYQGQYLLPYHSIKLTYRN